jgi:hypothetical protein
MQEGRHAAAVVEDRLAGRPGRPFHYFDKGNLATIGRARAVADVKGIRLSGFIAWVTWLTVHLFYLIGFENRLLVLIRWEFSFATHGRGARLITGEAEAPDLAPTGAQAGVRHSDRWRNAVADRPGGFQAGPSAGGVPNSDRRSRLQRQRRRRQPEGAS